MLISGISGDRTRLADRPALSRRAEGHAAPNTSGGHGCTQTCHFGYFGNFSSFQCRLEAISLRNPSCYWKTIRQEMHEIVDIH